MWREDEHLLRTSNYATGMVTFHIFAYSMERSRKRSRAGKRPDPFLDTEPERSRLVERRWVSRDKEEHDQKHPKKG